MYGYSGLDTARRLPDFYPGGCAGAAEVKFSAAIVPKYRKLTYVVDLKRVIMRKLIMGIADARMEVDGREIYFARDLRVDLFTPTEEL